jgi:hypothetical protein
VCEMVLPAAYDTVVCRADGVDKRCSRASVTVTLGSEDAQLVPSVALMWANVTPSDLIVDQLRLPPCQLETSHP